jgi:hypothetical protein
VENRLLLDLDRHGQLLDPGDGRPVPGQEVPSFLASTLEVPADISDIFVWVHGWRNSSERAATTATGFFDDIDAWYAKKAGHYPAIGRFRGLYVGVRWPSWSSISPWGYVRIRNRAHKMTTHGRAAHVLAHLLGYLHERREPPAGGDMLRNDAGQYLHCVGHSFGGRFLAEAIGAAADPPEPFLWSIPADQRFPFTVDSVLFFQMAARPDIFADRLAPVLRDAPLRGPICLTFSIADRANCLWHRIAERRPGIGCHGLTLPTTPVKHAILRRCDETYSADELDARVVNVDASWRYRGHSDFWHAESLHLLFTLANLARSG